MLFSDLFGNHTYVVPFHMYRENIQRRKIKQFKKKRIKCVYWACLTYSEHSSLSIPPLDCDPSNGVLTRDKRGTELPSTGRLASKAVSWFTPFLHNHSALEILVKQSKVTQKSALPLWTSSGHADTKRKSVTSFTVSQKKETLRWSLTTKMDFSMDNI